MDNFLVHVIRKKDCCQKKVLGIDLDIFFGHLCNNQSLSCPVSNHNLRHNKEAGQAQEGLVSQGRSSSMVVIGQYCDICPVIGRLFAADRDLRHSEPGQKQPVGPDISSKID